MPPEKTCSKVAHKAYGLMYLVAVLAGTYGLFHPAGQVQTLYGGIGNRVMLVLLTFGGLLGIVAVLTNQVRLELLSTPLLICAVAFIVPALFYVEVNTRQTAWSAWLTVALGAGFVTRWAEIRDATTPERRSARGRHRRQVPGR